MMCKKLVSIPVIPRNDYTCRLAITPVQKLITLKNLKITNQAEPFMGSQRVNTKAKFINQSMRLKRFRLILAFD